MNGNRFQLVSLMLSAVSLITLALGMWILSDLREEQRLTNAKINTHLSNHPDGALRERIAVLEYIAKVER